MKSALIATIAALAMAAPTSAQIVITEVHANGSGSGAAYAADWFELTNFGPSTVEIRDWRVDNNSYSFASSVALTGILYLPPGQSAIFVEGDISTLFTFIHSWWGGSAPFLHIGNYQGPGIELNSDGDGLQIFDSTGNVVTGVEFGSTVGELRTLDNAARIGGTGLPPPLISTFSAAGVNGAFVAATAPFEIGSPHAVPEPSSLAMAGIGAIVALRNRRKLKGLISR